MTTTALVEQRKIKITALDVKKYLCPKASDAEIALFLKVCQTEGLNPFAREVYMVKYTEDDPAAIIIAIETFLKAAEGCDKYNGHEAGIILVKNGEAPEFREGTFMLETEQNELAGGWAKVYRKDRDRPFYAAVNLKEYQKYTKQGSLTRFWREMPATMIRNVALRHALREAFPNRFAGLYTTAEIEPPPEGEVPPAYQKNGNHNWTKFWAKVKAELNIDSTKAHSLLNVSSIKADLVDKGKTLDQVFDMIAEAIKIEKLNQQPKLEFE